MESLVQAVGSEYLAWAIVLAAAAALLAGLAVVLRLRAREPQEAPTEQPRVGLDLQLGKVRESLLGRIQAALSGTQGETFAQLEEILVTSDFGLETTEALLARVKSKGASTPTQIRIALQEAILEVFQSVENPLVLSAKPTVIMVLGVNGVGKTTSIGKIAARNAAEGRKVLLAAGDTFRAAAIEQLTIWAERTGSDIVKGQPESDPAAVCFDAVKAGVARDVDLVLCDTAGRLHTKSNLMEELKKVKRVMAKAMPDAPHEVWLVLDATTGQNAMAQARQFNETVKLTGIIMTKLDGTAKGGILVGLVRELNVPIRYIGVGEGVDDLRPFHPVEYVRAILGDF